MYHSSNLPSEPCYEPLHLPDDFPKPFTWRHRIREYVRSKYGLSRKAKSLIEQMKLRGPISDEVWGPDPKRRALAKEVSQIVYEEIDWPNAHFIPEDPFRLVMFNVYWDGCNMDGSEIDCIAFRIAFLTGVDYYDNSIWGAFWGMSFGQVIDVLAQDPANAPMAVTKVASWPQEGPSALEALPCTAPAIFFDIRGFLTQTKYGVRTPLVKLSTPLETLANWVPPYELQHYVIRRFDIPCAISPDRFGLTAEESGLDLAKAALIGTVAMVFVFSALLGIPVLLGWAPWDSSMLFLPIGLAVIGIGVALAFSLPAVLARVRFRASLKNQPQTVRDLVEYIQRERARIAAGPSH